MQLSDLRPELDVVAGSTISVWKGELVPGLPSHIQQLARRRLRVLANISDPEELRVLRGVRFRRLERASGERRYRLDLGCGWALRFHWFRGRCSRARIVDLRGG